MKWIGAIVFISITTYLGFDASQTLTKRTSQLRSLIHSLRILEAEMGYSKLPLQDIFLAVSQTTISPVRDLYAHLAKRLQAGVTSFVQVWEEEIAHIQPHTALKESELDIMRQFGQSLGQHTFTQQQKQITLTIHHLQRILDEAEEQRYKYERMMKTLGVLVGIFVVLLIF